MLQVPGERERPGQKGRDFVKSELRGYVFISPHKARAHLTTVVVFISPQGLRTGVGLLGSGAFASASAYIMSRLPFRGCGILQYRRVPMAFQWIGDYLSHCNTACGPTTETEKMRILTVMETHLHAPKVAPYTDADVLPFLDVLCHIL